MKWLHRASPLLTLVSLLSLPNLAMADGTLSEKDAKKAAEHTLTQRNLHAFLSFIASDELEGRDTPSNGLNTAARYIASHLEQWGLTPKGDDGTFFQKIALRVVSLDGPNSSLMIAGKTLHYGADFLPDGGSKEKGTIATPLPLVFVGHGWFVKSKGIDAYAGLDVKGKIVVVAPTGGFGPPGLGPTDLTRAGRGKDWMSPDMYATQSGAAGIIRLPRFTTAPEWAKLVTDTKPLRRVGTTMIRPGDKASDSIPSFTLSPDAANALFAHEKITLETALSDAKTKPETAGFTFSSDTTASLTLGIREETVMTQNVVAVWEGSDSKLKNQYVALGAHYDHIGISSTPNATGDVINNGADDDGSGTVALLTMAETLATRSDSRPKRSILFVWHCGEEKGLWGSSYFTSNPTVPITDIVTQLNIDMIGRSKADPNDSDPRNATLSNPNTIYVIGSRMLSNDLGDIVERVNKDYTQLNYDFQYDDPKDPNQFYYRSDHYNYAQRGIPIAFFFDGVHADYHRVTDEVSKIDFPKYERVARTIFLTAVAIADRDEAPALLQPKPVK